MRALPKAPELRRTVAMATAALVIAGGATLTSAGSAGAATPSCGSDQGGTSGAPWYSWHLVPCVNYDSYNNKYYPTVHIWGGSTDVRIYQGIYDSCNGVTYGVNGDSNSNHIFPGDNWIVAGNSVPNPYCGSGVWAIARISESGNGSPWAWSSRM
ncbi:hypothetical protein [Kitasatospora terrestris]|uniref:Secreted protein n=1 Tax=Kitasatospora terrestris TaxID=258051 RepID=A0ABP9D8J2_9ACTN